MIIALVFVMAFTLLSIIALLALKGRSVPHVLSLVLLMLVSHILGIDVVHLLLLIKHLGM